MCPPRVCVASLLEVGGSVQLVSLFELYYLLMNVLLPCSLPFTAAAVLGLNNCVHVQLQGVQKKQRVRTTYLMPKHKEACSVLHFLNQAGRVKQQRVSVVLVSPVYRPSGHQWISEG